MKTRAVPDSVSRIDSYAFFGRKGLTSIAVPESVRYIFDYAFAYCDNLASLTVPDTVESIGGGAFLGIPHIEYHGSYETGKPSKIVPKMLLDIITFK